MSRVKKILAVEAASKGVSFLTPAATTVEVVRKMQAIQAAFSDADGVRCFNELYLSVTLAVTAEIAKSKAFEDAAWMERLDICFANLYFAALATAQKQGIDEAPAAWQPLFQSRSAKGIARLQFALAGMNAHINRDLVAALLAMYSADGNAPGLNSARFRDFNRVNQILERVETQMRPALLVGTPLAKGGHCAPLEDILAMWSVTAARQAAWNHSQALWRLRMARPLQRASFDSLDGLTEVAGKGLLIRVLR